MKKVIIASLMFACAVVQAQSVTVVGGEKGKVTLTQITQGISQVVTPPPNCPPGAACGIASFLNLTVSVSGCADTALISYSVVKSQANANMKVLVSALNVSNPKSKSIKCIMQQTVTKRIFLGQGFITEDNVKVEFLNNLAQ